MGSGKGQARRTQVSSGQKLSSSALLGAKGAVEWRIGGIKEGKLHREDGPAIATLAGVHGWYINGKIHRDGGPAIESTDGKLAQWWRHGLQHRDDGPAGVYKGIKEEWWQQGQLHREDGPAVEEACGTKRWYQKGRLHRVGGPAVELLNGDTEWYVDGVCHREDGPALEFGDKSWPGEYWLYGEHVDADALEKNALLKRLSGVRLDAPEKTTF